jgi:hypothetical protein
VNIDRLPGQGEVLCAVLRYVARVLVQLLQNKLANFLALFILRRSHPAIVKVIRRIVKCKVWFVKYLIAAVSAVVPPLKRRRVTTMPATAVAASSSAEGHHHHHQPQEQEDLVAVAMATAMVMAIICAVYKVSSLNANRSIGKAGIERPSADSWRAAIQKTPPQFQPARFSAIATVTRAAAPSAAP